MKPMAFKASRKVSNDALWELSIFCQKLKNGDVNLEYISNPDTIGTEGDVEICVAVQEEANKYAQRFPTTKTAYLEFLMALLRDYVPLYTAERVRKVSNLYRQNVRVTGHQNMINHFTQWENAPKTDAAWDYFFHFMAVDRLSKENSVPFYKTHIYKLEQTAADWQFELTPTHYHNGLFELWKQQKFNRPQSFEKLILGFQLDGLNVPNGLPNKDFFQEICQLMPLKSTFIMGLTKATFSGLHGLFNRFWQREMPLFFEKIGKNMPTNLTKVHKPQMARFFELWLKSKYPKMFERAMSDQTQVPHFEGKWSFRQVIQYLPPCTLSEWGKYPSGSWQFAFIAHLGAGGSPRTFLLPPQYWLSKRGAYLFVTADVGLNLVDILHNAMFATLSCPMTLQVELSPHILNYPAPLFEDCVRFFMRENKEIDNYQYRNLFNYINHKVEETGTFNFKGRTITSLLRAYNEWQGEIVLMRLKAEKEQKWVGAKMKDMDFKNAQGKVLHRFIQLKNAYDLAIEGAIMHHCVGGYVWHCIEGTSSIWSLRRLEKDNTVSLVTVEVSHKKIIQARGPYNAIPSNDEQALIKKWADTEGVEFLHC